MVEYSYTLFLLSAITLMIYLLYRRVRGNKTQKIMFIGENNTGKTVTFYQLYSGKFVETVSSMAINKSKIFVNQKEIYIEDIPGYMQFRNYILENLKSFQYLCVFVSNEQTQFSQTADLIYSILVQKSFQQSNIKASLIINNFSQQSKGDEIRGKIIKEIDFLKISKQAIKDENPEVNDYLQVK